MLKIHSNKAGIPIMKIDKKFNESLKKNLNTALPSDESIHMITTYASVNQPQEKKTLNYRWGIVGLIAIILILSRIDIFDNKSSLYDDSDQLIAELATYNDTDEFDEYDFNELTEFEELLEISTSIDLLLND